MQTEQKPRERESAHADMRSSRSSSGLAGVSAVVALEAAGREELETRVRRGTLRWQYVCCSGDAAGKHLFRTFDELNIPDVVKLRDFQLAIIAD